MTLECSVRSQERTVSVEEAEEEEEEEERRPLSMLAEKQRQSACSAATTTRGEAAWSLRTGSVIDNERVKQATSCGQKKKCDAQGKEMLCICMGSRATRSCGAEKAGALGGHEARKRITIAGTRTR
jgi:hypothetical protein